MFIKSNFFKRTVILSLLTLSVETFNSAKSLVLSVSTIYILGILWLGSLLGWDKPIIDLGITPFLYAEFFKITLLTITAKKILKIRKFI